MYLLSPIIVTSRNLVVRYRQSAVNTQSSGLDFPPDRIIIAHQFRAGSLRCDAMRCDAISSSARACIIRCSHLAIEARLPLDATWINGVRVRKYSLAVNRISPSPPHPSSSALRNVELSVVFNKRIIS